MAKKQSMTAPPTGDMVAAVRSMLSSTLGNVSVTEMSSFTAIAGPPIPSIAVQWVLNTSVLPLRFLGIAAAPETGKSTLMYEIQRWFLGVGGHVVLFETEGKDNSDIRTGIYKRNPDYISRVTAVPVTVYEKWAGGVTSVMDYYRKQFDAGAPQVPVLICVDSLAAAPMEQSVDEVRKEGVNKADFPRLPKALSSFFRNYPELAAGYPFMFLFTNHTKQSMNALTPNSEYQIGGKSVDYHESISIKLSPAAREARFVRTNCSGRRLKMTTGKNSLGPRRDIEIVLYFRNIPNPSFDPASPYSEKYLLDVDFDWGEVDIRFLSSVMDGNKPGFGMDRRNALRDMLDLNIVSKGNSSTYVWSNALDVPKDSPVTFTEAGKLIMGNEELLRGIQDELGIKRNVVYRAGMDYRQVLSDYIKEQERLVLMGNPANDNTSFNFGDE